MLNLPQSKVTQQALDDYLKRVFAVNGKQQYGPLTERKRSDGLYEGVDKDGKVRILYGEHFRNQIQRWHEARKRLKPEDYK